MLPATCDPCVMNVIDIMVTNDEFNVKTITTKCISNNLINVPSANLEEVVKVKTA